MPIVEVKLLEGRTKAMKATLIKAVTDAVETSLGVPRESIRVLLVEIAPEHWGAGGVPKG
jgi:4-oxalocrotonate tautomerase